MCMQSHCTSCDRGQQADRFIPVQFRTITPRLRAFYFIIPPILLRQIQPQQTISSTASSSLLSTNTATNQRILWNAATQNPTIHPIPSLPAVISEFKISVRDERQWFQISAIFLCVCLFCFCLIVYTRWEYSIYVAKDAVCQRTECKQVVTSKQSVDSIR